MSPVCHNFVQNAWKKDMCSNCFKSREEHNKHDKVSEGSKYLATPFQNRSTFFKKTPTGILKIHSKKKHKRNVRFPAEVSSVIGYGGDDWSDGEEFEISEDNDDEDTFPDTEEERELHRITKTNTDFNTVKANLMGETVMKSYTSLMLGKVQTDSDGKKKTLLVSVTPFGQENKTPNIKAHSRKPAANIHIISPPLEDTGNDQKNNITLTNFVQLGEDTTDNKELTKTENDTDKLCTEKSLLEEISETLEKNRLSDKAELNLQESLNNRPIIIEECTKPQELVDKKENTECKRNSLTRNTPVIKNQERPKLNVNIRSECKLTKLNVDSSSVDSAVSLNSTANNSVASDDESLSGRVDSDNDDSGHFTEPQKSEETVKITIFSNQETNNIKQSPLSKLRNADGQSNGYSTFQAPVIDLPPIIPKSIDTVFAPEASRESAGEPDGRADPDDSFEIPALPNSPVPLMDPRPSFLHGMIGDIMPQATKPAVPEKPKLPIKPVIKQNYSKKITAATNQSLLLMHMQTVQMKKDEEAQIINMLNEEKNNEITEVNEDKPEPIYYAQPVLTKQDSDSSISSMNKRQAPTPPTSPTVDDYPNIYQRNPNVFMKSDSPVVREKEKRERAITVPKKSVDDNSDGKKSSDSTPEPAPRRSISLSHDNLLIDDKRKGKYKFSIKKLLRIGSSKDIDKKELSVASVTKVPVKVEEAFDITPKPKPRLVIIHPLDINGTNVEVVKNNEITETLRRMSHDDSSSIYSGSSNNTDPEIPVRVTNKPPPPPRHINEESKSTSTPTKPARPPPPKSAVLQKKQKQQVWTSATSKNDTNIYANLGEIRSALAPRKPERTASMREREAQLELPKRRNQIDDDKEDDDEPQELVQATNEPVIHNYDDVYNTTKYDSEDNIDSAKNSDSDYEYVNHDQARSSSPECDSGNKIEETENHAITNRKNDSIDYPKYNNSLNRSSLPYCGSETESEIYSPYSFYSSDNMDSPTNEDYQNDMNSKTTTNKLRVRKGRSIVHRNLEDNYGAVIIANHEALAQVLEQVQQSASIPSSLRGLKTCTNLRWTDFSVQYKGSAVKAGRRIFYPAVWNSSQGPVNLTTMLHKEHMASQIVCQQSVQPQSLSLNAVTEFCDVVPLYLFSEDGEDLVQATIVVLSSAQVDTIQSYGEALHSTEGLSTKEYQLVSTEQMHEAVFMMLQLINGLKCLQGRGIEEISDSLTSFVALRENTNSGGNHGSTMNLQDDRLTSLSAPKTNCYGRLCILQGLNSTKSTEEGPLSSLCKCAIKALEILLPGEKSTPLLKDLLAEERAVSLNQAKSVLEFMLWGPLDVVQGVPVAERELSLQRWLDLERATVLHGLVRSRVQLNVFEQMHLMFLVRSTAKAMCDASVLLENANVY